MEIKMISYFDSKNPNNVTFDEAISYIEMVEKYKKYPEFKKITDASNKLSASNADSFIKEFETQMTQNRLLPLEFETLAKLKDVFTDKNHYLQETIDETIKQKTHILKNLHSFAKNSSGFGIMNFIEKKKLENKGLDTERNGDLYIFSKNSTKLYGYDKSNQKLYVEGADIRDGGGTTRIEFKNGNLNVRDDLNTIEYHLNKRPSRKIKP